jgi:hypothetical protein
MIASSPIRRRLRPPALALLAWLPLAAAGQAAPYYPGPHPAWERRSRLGATPPA